MGRYRPMISAFESIFNKADKEAQAFVTEFRSRIAKIESTLSDDWESDEFVKSTAQIKFLERCVNIVITQQNMSVILTDAIAKDIIQQIDYQSEIARLKANNLLLMRICGKIRL